MGKGNGEGPSGTAKDRLEEVPPCTDEASGTGSPSTSGTAVVNRLTDGTCRPIVIGVQTGYGISVGRGATCPLGLGLNGSYR